MAVYGHGNKREKRGKRAGFCCENVGATATLLESNKEREQHSTTQLLVTTYKKPQHSKNFNFFIINIIIA